MRPLSLLKARLGYSVVTEINGQPATTDIEFGFGGRVVIEDLQAVIAIEQLLPLVSRLALPIDGTLMADIKKLRVNGVYLKKAMFFSIKQAGWRLMRPPLALGDFIAQVTTEDEVIKAQLSDEPGAAVSAQGMLTLDQEGAYNLELLLRPKGNADQRLSNLLKGLGKPDAKGWYMLKSNGSL